MRTQIFVHDIKCQCDVQIIIRIICSCLQVKLLVFSSSSQCLVNRLLHKMASLLRKVFPSFFRTMALLLHVRKMASVLRTMASLLRKIVPSLLRTMTSVHKMASFLHKIAPSLLRTMTSVRMMASVLRKTATSFV